MCVHCGVVALRPCQCHNWAKQPYPQPGGMASRPDHWKPVPLRCWPHGLWERNDADKHFSLSTCLRPSGPQLVFFSSATKEGLRGLKGVKKKKILIPVQNWVFIRCLVLVSNLLSCTGRKKEKRINDNCHRAKYSHLYVFLPLLHCLTFIDSACDLWCHYKPAPPALMLPICTTQRLCTWLLGIYCNTTVCMHFYLFSHSFWILTKMCFFKQGHCEYSLEKEPDLDLLALKWTFRFVEDRVAVSFMSQGALMSVFPSGAAS